MRCVRKPRTVTLAREMITPCPVTLGRASASNGDGDEPNDVDNPHPVPSALIPSPDFAVFPRNNCVLAATVARRKTYSLKLLRSGRVLQETGRASVRLMNSSKSQKFLASNSVNLSKVDTVDGDRLSMSEQYHACSGPAGQQDPQDPSSLRTPSGLVNICPATTSHTVTHPQCAYLGDRPYFRKYVFHNASLYLTQPSFSTPYLDTYARHSNLSHSSTAPLDFLYITLVPDPSGLCSKLSTMALTVTPSGVNVARAQSCYASCTPRRHSQSIARRSSCYPWDAAMFDLLALKSWFCRWRWTAWRRHLTRRCRRQ